MQKKLAKIIQFFIKTIKLDKFFNSQPSIGKFMFEKKKNENYILKKIEQLNFTK